MANLTDERRARYRQELEETNFKTSTFTKINWYKLPVGTTRVRVLPGLDEASADKDFYCRAATHYGLSPQNPKIPVTCPKSKNPKSFCPACEKYETLKKSSSAADNNAAEKIRAKTKYYVALVPREGEGAGQVFVYPMPKAAYVKMISIMEDPEFGDVTSIPDGRDIKITRTGEQRDTRYDVLPTGSTSPLSKDPKEVQFFLDNRPELWRFREAPSTDEIEKFMEGELTTFTTGGFATNIKTVEPGNLNSVAEILPFDETQVQEEEEEVQVPVAAKKSKGFANLDDLRKELKGVK